MMRVTPFSRLRGQILRCSDCGFLCRTSALRAGDDSCPRCGVEVLVVVGTGKPFCSTGRAC